MNITFFAELRKGLKHNVPPKHEHSLVLAIYPSLSNELISS